MPRAKETNHKHTTLSSSSIFQSLPARIMVPRLMVILSVVALLVLGIVMVYSASSITLYIEEGDSLGETFKQLLFVTIGIVLVALVIRFCTVDFLRGNACLIFWIVCVAGLALTAVAGTSALGAKRWIYLGGMSLQVSEFAKIAICLMVVKTFCDYLEGDLPADRAMALGLIYVLVPLVFIAVAQSDMGTTVICVVAILTVFILGGFPLKWLVLAILAVCAAGLVLIFSSPYRLARIMVMLDPWSDASDGAYQLIHSFQALAGGGLFGEGLGNSYQKMQYLPEAETDFIFSIIGEEMGLIGTLGVIALFLFLLRGGLTIARESDDPFSYLMAGSLTTMLVFQAFLNICCAIGLLPTTGKPLPFISSGGSSMISSMLIVGLILSVSFSSSAQEHDYQKRRDNLRVVSTYNTENVHFSSYRRQLYSRYSARSGVIMQSQQSNTRFRNRS